MCHEVDGLGATCASGAHLTTTNSSLACSSAGKMGEVPLPNVGPNRRRRSGLGCGHCSLPPRSCQGVEQAAAPAHLLSPRARHAQRFFAASNACRIGRPGMEMRKDGQRALKPGSAKASLAAADHGVCCCAARCR